MKPVPIKYLDFFIVLSFVFSLSIFDITEFTVDVHAKSTSDTFLNNRESDTKYILRWPDIPTSPFFSAEEGNGMFINNKCKHTNCFITNNKTYFNGESNRNFDAVVFNGRLLKNLNSIEMPRNRLPYQKYIFAMMESPRNYPIRNKDLDGFFNWTWTYKTNSDIRWGYFTIYDLNGTVVGPKTEMHWINYMDPINDELKRKLSSKTKAVAWFVSNCHSKNGREKFANEVKNELKGYGWSADIFGRCGSLQCPRKDKNRCDKMIEDEYYFYLAFENSFAEDYVTEKLTTALNNYAVPVVFGGANYSRYLPKGSYLDGRKLGAKNLAKAMDEIIRNKTRYYDFFRWRNHYVYKDTAAYEDICSLCAILSDNDKFEETIVWNNFRSWWNDDKPKQCSITKKKVMRKPKKIMLKSLSTTPHVYYPNKDIPINVLPLKA